MKYKLCWPEGRAKALTFSYDDGRVHDRKLVELFNRYGLRGTFHLNSGMLGMDRYITAEEIPELYAGHEVACHGVNHSYPTHLGATALAKEIWEDRAALEDITGAPVTGHSYAFGQYSERVRSALSGLGITYSRTVENTDGFHWPEDFLRWHPSCHHDGKFAEMTERFLHMPSYAECPLFYVWGHSYEFEDNGNWDAFEAVCAQLANQPDVWYATNIEIQRYMYAARELQSNVRGTVLYNPGSIQVWLTVGDAPAAVNAGETLFLS